MKTNILVCYEGGGYDGCYWEWNYFYIDRQGTFHDIHSSGRAGIDNQQDALKLIEQDETHTYIYDLSNEQSIIAFSKETHAAHVSGVLRWFDNYNDADIEFFAVCSECDGHIDIDDAVVDSTEIICSECYLIGQCQCCEQYVGADNITNVDADLYTGDYDYLCTDCKENLDADIAAEQLADIRWQAFCTGTPDMFSGELREQRLQTNGGL